MSASAYSSPEGPAVQDAPGGEAPPTPSFGGGVLSVEDVGHGWDSPAPERTQDSLGTSMGSKVASRYFAGNPCSFVGGVPHFHAFMIEVYGINTHYLPP